MPLIKVGRYVINTDHIVYVNLDDRTTRQDHSVVVYFNWFSGEVLTGGSEDSEAHELRTKSLQFSGDDAKRLQEYFGESSNVTIIS